MWKSKLYREINNYLEEKTACRKYLLLRHAAFLRGQRAARSETQKKHVQPVIEYVVKYTNVTMYTYEVKHTQERKPARGTKKTYAGDKEKHTIVIFLG